MNNTKYGFYNNNNNNKNSNKFTTRKRPRMNNNNNNNNLEKVQVIDYNSSSVFFKSININNYPVSKISLSTDRMTVYPSSFIYFLEDENISDKLAIHKCNILNSTRDMTFKLSPIIEQLIKEHYPNSEDTITEFTDAFTTLYSGKTLIVQINPCNRDYIRELQEEFKPNSGPIDIVKNTTSINIGDRENSMFFVPKSISKVSMSKPTPMLFDIPSAERTPQQTNEISGTIRNTPLQPVPYPGYPDNSLSVAVANTNTDINDTSSATTVATTVGPETTTLVDSSPRYTGMAVNEFDNGNSPVWNPEMETQPGQQNESGSPTQLPPATGGYSRIRNNKITKGENKYKVMKKKHSKKNRK